jgi:pimeloyl-ACP methyl ester carboxylesterase
MSWKEKLNICVELVSKCPCFERKGKTMKLSFILLYVLLLFNILPMAAQQPVSDISVPTKLVEVNNDSFPVIDAGSGPAVLLLHGFPDSKELWKHQIPTLISAGYRVVAPDLRGVGAAPSPLAKEQYAMPLLIGDVLGILDALGLDKVHLVGHDWGAALAWQLASYFEPRFITMTVFSVGYPGNPGWTSLEQREKSWYFYLFLQEGLAEKTLSDNNWAFTRKFLSSHKDLDQVLQRLQKPNALTTALNWYRGNLQHLVAQADTDYSVTNEAPATTASSIKIPVLGVWSDQDIALLEPQMKLSSDYVQDFTYKKVTGAGHWMMLDQPEQVSQLLLDFLDQTE